MAEPTAFLHPGVKMADYVADRFDLPPTLNSGLAHVMLTKSPAHVRYHHPRLRPDWTPDDERAFDLGSAAHGVLLEGREVFVVDFPDYRSKQAQAVRDDAKAAGLLPVLSKHASDIACMVTSARAKMAASPDLEKLGELLAERTLLWQECIGQRSDLTDYNVWLRSRPDWISADYRVLISAKTTRASAEPDAFMKTILGGGYDVQAAFEWAGVHAATGVTPTHYIWLVMECEPPFACSLIGRSPMLRDLGERKMAAAVTAWAHCLATDEWPDYGEHVAYPDPPEWALMRFAERFGVNDPRDESVEAL